MSFFAKQKMYLISETLLKACMTCSSFSACSVGRLRTFYLTLSRSTLRRSRMPLVLGLTWALSFWKDVEVTGLRNHRMLFCLTIKNFVQWNCSKNMFKLVWICDGDTLNISGRLHSIYSEIYFLLLKLNSSLEIKCCMCSCVYMCFMFLALSVTLKRLIQFLMRGNIIAGFVFFFFQNISSFVLFWDYMIELYIHRRGDASAE